ncbi:MAG: RusA family crossover junction endodeoxyribonuclease [Ignavibacteriaceae bacterium]
MLIKRFVIPGNPIALARPRFAHKHVFDSQHLEKLNAGLLIRNQLGNVSPSENVPLSMSIKFVMPIPSCSKVRHAKYIDAFHLHRPDIDNLCKFVLDICNNVVYKDDCIIVKLIATKIYGEEPRTEFTIKEMEIDNEMEKAL